MPRYTYVPLSQALAAVARTTRYVVAESASYWVMRTRWHHAERRPMTREEEDMASAWMGPTPIRTADLAAWAREAEARGELAVRARVRAEDLAIVYEDRRPAFVPWNGDLHVDLNDDQVADELTRKLIAAIETFPHFREAVKAALSPTALEPAPATEVEHPDRYARLLERG